MKNYSGTEQRKILLFQFYYEEKNPCDINTKKEKLFCAIKRQETLLKTFVIDERKFKSCTGRARLIRTRLIRSST